MPKKSNIMVLGDMTLSNGAGTLLKLGPSSSLAQIISKATMRTIVCGLYELREKLRNKAQLETPNEMQEVGALSLPPLTQT
ncbi:unnamed protein product [Angiostrongylus costaricensis]|uniref:Uncharacterized protein n=1 Tax=Angiostrongylus costaricensis TaxID=334426 RepID=A0A0R3PUG6_ANGCS|nr:unnamed protein product [Angiostrongylus costaricensis]